MPIISSVPGGFYQTPPSTVLDLTIPAAAWVGSGIPYTQIVTVPGVTSNNYVTISPTETVTKTQYDAINDAKILGTSQNENTIVLTAFGEKPSIDIPLRFIISTDIVSVGGGHDRKYTEMILYPGKTASFTYTNMVPRHEYYMVELFLISELQNRTQVNSGKCPCYDRISAGYEDVPNTAYNYTGPMGEAGVHTYNWISSTGWTEALPMGALKNNTSSNKMILIVKALIGRIPEIVIS